MAKRKQASKSKSSASGTLNDKQLSQIIGLLLLLVAAYLFIAFVSYIFTWKADQSALQSANFFSFIFNSDIHVENALGRLGCLLSHFFFYKLVGISSFLIIFGLSVTGINFLQNKSIFNLPRIYQRILVAMLLLSVSLAFIFSSSGFPWGGGIGVAINGWLISFIGYFGTGLLLLFTVLALLIFYFNVDIYQSANRVGKHIKVPSMPNVKFPTKSENNNSRTAATTATAANITKNTAKPEEKTPEPEEKETIPSILPLEFSTVKKNANTPSSAKDDLLLDIEISKPSNKNGQKTTEIIHLKNDAPKEIVHAEGDYNPHLDLKDYQLPSFELLEIYKDAEAEIDKEELERNKNQIVDTLLNYNIAISRISAKVGPTITLYEIVPVPGVRISRIKNLEDDIALSLAALGIRIIAPIPGKGTIGIEVPNHHKEIVSLREILETDEFKQCKYELPIALGNSISRGDYIADLAKMPHLLLAGATGQGKSVGINAILISLLYKKHPSELKLVLIDPKKVELSIYEKIENYFLASIPGVDDCIITDTSQVINTLNSLCVEMDNRYNLLKNASVRNIKEYNHKFVKRRLNPEKGHQYLPYIVLVIDEFADLIMTAGKEIEQPLTRLAQLARAVGIHLVIATQRPTVNIITGTIKANFPVRIAFRVTAKIDSRTILDTGGADQLVGRGDMLLLSGADLYRLQCAFIDTPEVDRVLDAIADQQGYNGPFELPEYLGEDRSSSKGSLSLEERDPLFEEAAQLIVTAQSGSTSLIQRRLKLGYNRAGRLMDQLEQAGIVGPNQGSKPRDVLIGDIISLERFLSDN
ncbi:MAG: DNA translocase FtsK 4TM domain-containing protein [Chitinophagales bacterium]|nr:DNA translocase FtsK 4TM domain-containing protein [Bacteroidota bacterium]MCB9042470.1 DNA translocase FtsK 4TM domain-containing protein [Chitinophagales bacterium]